MADALVTTAPHRFTANIRKNKRGGKIFIDYLRNSATASAIAPYSTRARDGAPVALPLDWKDLARLKSGNAFSMQDALKQLRKDPWKGMAMIKQKLPV